MSFKQHRRNFSLIGTTQPRVQSPPALSRSLRKIQAPNNYYWLLASAKQFYFKSNDMKAAITNFEEYLKHNPNHLESLYLCGVCYMHINQYQQAIQKLTEYLSMRKTSFGPGRKLIINASLPTNSKAFLLLSMAYNKLNICSKALESVNQAIKIDPHFEEGYCFRAKLFLKIDELHKAFIDYRQALKINSKCLAAQIGLGDYYASSNNYSSALKHYEAAEQWLREQTLQQGQEDEATLSQIYLKLGICGYHMQEYPQSKNLLMKALSYKKNPNLSQIYYYLGQNQLKQHKAETEKKKEHLNKFSSRQTENYLRQAILNLQFSIKSQNNVKIMNKACKTLIKIFVQNNQLYETENIIAMADKYKLDISNYKQLCEGCMLVIKQKYPQALPILKKLYERVMQADKKPAISPKKQQIRRTHVIAKNSSKKLKAGRHSHPHNLFMKKPQMDEIDLEKGHHLSQSQNPKKQLIKENDLEWMKPIVLLYRAYAEFFSDNFIECLETFELYENYTKDYLGKQPESDIYLSYNKMLCEGLLMLDNQMMEECLDKFNQCIDNYYKFMRGIPAEPILYRIIALMRLALSEYPVLTVDINSRSKIMVMILDCIDHYMPAIKKNPLIHYYMSLAYYDLEKYKEASDALEVCLKIADECSWKFLYVKGVIQMKRKAYKEAIREFAAGIMIEERSDFYLGRCLCYIGLFEQSSEDEAVYIEKSFQDLQKFIELQDEKQKISKWVTKILFFNKAYDQVEKSVKKVPVDVAESDEEIIRIVKFLKIYQGEFEEGGIAGRVIMNAFDGVFQQNYLLIQDEKHEILLGDFFSPAYIKWLHILSLYSGEKYSELIKFLQLTIFEEKNCEEQLELRYNLGITYYLVGEIAKGDNVMGGLSKYSADITPRTDKFLSRDWAPDQCVLDLEDIARAQKKLSSFLPFKRIQLPRKGLLQSELPIFVKISIPFPQCHKPNIILSLDDKFLAQETCQSCIPKKVEAPWIKKVTGKIQFTDTMIESLDASFINYEQEEGILDSVSSSNFEAHLTVSSVETPRE